MVVGLRRTLQPGRHTRSHQGAFFWFCWPLGASGLQVMFDRWVWFECFFFLFLSPWEMLIVFIVLLSRYDIYSSPKHAVEIVSQRQILSHRS